MRCSGSVTEVLMLEGAFRVRRLAASGAPEMQDGRSTAQPEGSESALGAGQVDGTSLRQQVPDGRGGEGGKAHVRFNRPSCATIPWFGSHRGADHRESSTITS